MLDVFDKININAKMQQISHFLLQFSMTPSSSAEGRNGETLNYHTAPGTRPTDGNGNAIRLPGMQQEYVSPLAEKLSADRIAFSQALLKKYAGRR